MKQLTPEEYVALKGIKCPFCGSHGLTGGPVEIDSGGASQEVTCLDCDHTWLDEYTLTGYQGVD